MAAKQFTPGAFVRIPLADGTYGYGRLREFPYAVFYDLRTEAPTDDLDLIAGRPVLFTLAVHKSVVNAWEVIGSRPLEEALTQPVVQFMQKIGNPSDCRIVDSAGNERRATPQECEGLERVSVWEANHVQDRLLDTFLGRPNVWADNAKVKQ